MEMDEFDGGRLREMRVPAWLPAFYHSSVAMVTWSLISTYKGINVKSQIIKKSMF